MLIPFVKEDETTLMKTVDLFALNGSMLEIKEKCSHLLPFILQMGRYLQNREQILADVDMIRIMELTDQIRQLLDPKSRLFYALNAYAAVS